jgi:hypothetical protein
LLGEAFSPGCGSSTVPTSASAASAVAPGRAGSDRQCMAGIVIALLVLWLILAVLGLVIKGLVWLTIIGVILFLATAVWGWVRRKV